MSRTYPAVRARCFIVAGTIAVLSASAGAQLPQSNDAFLQCSPEQYRDRLTALQKTVETCLASHITQTCDPALVGPDLKVMTPAGLRTVHLDWARAALAAGRVPGADDDGNLHRAEARIAQDLSADAAQQVVDPQVVARVHKRLETVLARSEFHRVQDPGLLARAQQAVLKWIFERLEALTTFGGSNQWLSTVLESLVIGVPCVLLLLWVIRKLAMPEPLGKPSSPVDSNVPSARSWQRWLIEAEDCANQNRWRDAIHGLYWSAISRLEASGLWPADVARTPREYLSLLHGEHALRGDLGKLTRSFERFWYGNRRAQESDYRAARELLERLRPR